MAVQRFVDYTSISNNVGSVKSFLNTLLPALRGARHNERLALSIRSHCPVLIHPGGEIAEVSRGQCLAGSGLKIHNIEGLVRRGDDSVALLQDVKNPNAFPSAEALVAGTFMSELRRK